MEFTAITSRQNATLKHLARLAREKKYRLKTGEMVCEGEKMLGEALDSDIRVGAVLVRAGTACDDALLARAAAQGASLLTAEKALFDLATDVETPQGVLFSCERPVRQTVDFSSVRRVVLLDGLQDPGNLGTILRTADAFALDLVILCEGCTDPTAPKVVALPSGSRSVRCRLPRPSMLCSSMASRSMPRRSSPTASRCRPKDCPNARRSSSATRATASHRPRSTCVITSSSFPWPDAPNRSTRALPRPF